jgi:DNA-binding response OmpR family regulator
MKKILIVDDQEEVRELVNVTLKMPDYKIFKAKSGEEAVKVASQENPDLIIMDVVMPGKINGLEATRILKQDKKTQGIHIIMLTSKGHQADIKKGEEAGANDYLIKPFSPLELIRKVEDALA